MTRANYDSPWKDVLKHFFPAFMMFCLPDIAQEIDWSRNHEFLDKELHALLRDQKIGKRIADKLVKVWLQNGEECWLLIHIEVQAQPEPDFPQRMYIYNYRIFDYHHQPIVSIAILADDDPHWRPSTYKRVYWQTKLFFEFETIKLLDYRGQEEKLSQNSNPFAIVIWAHLAALQTKQQDALRFQSKTTITRALYEHGFSKQYVINLFRFIDWIMALPKPLELEYTKIIEQLEEEKQMAYITSVERIGMQKGWQQGHHEGLQEGRQEGFHQGREKAMKELAAKLLQEKILPIDRVAQITELSLETLTDLYNEPTTG